MVWIVQPRVAITLPNLEHAAHGNIHASVSERIHLDGIRNKIENFLVHRNGCNPRVLIDGAEVIHAVVGVVNVVKLMIVQQDFVQFLKARVCVLFARIVENHRGGGVEYVQINLVKALRFRCRTSTKQYA